MTVYDAFIKTCGKAKGVQIYFTLKNICPTSNFKYDLIYFHFREKQIVKMATVVEY